MNYMYLSFSCIGIIRRESKLEIALRRLEATMVPVWMEVRRARRIEMATNGVRSISSSNPGSIDDRDSC